MPVKSYFVVFLVAAVSACAFPTREDITYRGVTRGDVLIVHGDDKETFVKTLMVHFKTTPKYKPRNNVLVDAYKCGADHRNWNIGAAFIWPRDGDLFYIDVPLWRYGTLQRPDFDLRTNPFDVCVYLWEAAYPLRRESNVIRVPVSDIRTITEHEPP